MKTNSFEKGKVHIGLLSILYAGAVFCALVLRRYHQALCFSDTEMIENLPHPWLYYVLFAIFSTAFLVLAFNSSKRKALIGTYAVTVSTILVLYKLVIPLLKACFYCIGFILDAFFAC